MSVPEGEILVRLFEGAVGPTRLAQATATARLDSQQCLAFDCHLEPAQARQTGHVKLSGSLPLLFNSQAPDMVLALSAPPPPLLRHLPTPSFLIWILVTDFRKTCNVHPSASLLFLG